jgi:peroxiredoxin Q/BCP
MTVFVSTSKRFYEEVTELVDRLKKPEKMCIIPISISIQNFFTPEHKKSQEVTMPIQEGKTAPAFSLPDANGNKVALKDFKGKNVIVYFYPKDDTPG